MQRSKGKRGLEQAEFDALIKAERWETLEDRLRELVREDPKNHWAVTNIAMACNELRRYQDAKDWSDIAYGLDPRCPAVRWDRAGIYDNLGDSERAIAFWKSILETPEWEIRDNPCWESKEWTQRLLADCWYRLSIAYLREWAFPESEDAEAMYKKLIDEGAGSIYTVEELDQALARLRQDEASNE